MPQCQLRLANPPCAFSAKTGASVTLEVREIVGNANFAAAKYAGTALTTPAMTITFVVLAGQNDLDMTLAFDNVLAGRAEIREVCDGHQLIALFFASDPFKRLTICGVEA